MNCSFKNSASHALLNITKLETKSSQGILVSILLLVSIWIVVINALIFVCLLTSRKALKTFVNIQMLSFSLTDMFVGLCAIPVTLTYQITTAFPYFEACAGIFYGYSISQAATMYHAFVICIHRIVIIKRYSGRQERNPKSMLRTLFLQIALIWLFSMFIVSVPFGIYGRFGQPLRGCSLNTLFEENYIHFCAFMDTILLIPQIGMNVVYVYMFWFLFTTWRNSRARHGQFRSVPSNLFVNASFAEESTTDNASKFPSNSTPGAKTMSLAEPNISDDGTKSQSNPSRRDNRPSFVEERSSDNGATFINQSSRSQRKCFSSESKSERVSERRHSEKRDALKVNFEMGQITKEKDKENIRPCLQNGSCKVDRPASLQTDVNRATFDIAPENGLQNKAFDPVTKKHFSKLKRKASKRNREIKLNYEGQKEVLITIGLILLVVNVTMTPLNTLVVIELLTDGFLSRETKLILVSFAMMNSALNPGIYAMRIKLFRKAVSKSLKTCLINIFGYIRRIGNY